MNAKASSLLSWLRRFMSPATLACLLVLGYIIFSGENTVFRFIEYDRTIDRLLA